MLPNRILRTLLLVALIAAAPGCRTATNYTDPDGPRFAGPVPDPAPPGDTVLVVTFNVEKGERVDRAIAALQADSVARGADNLLLQEMDTAGTRRIAEAFRMGWVYYPARLAYDGARSVGTAVLSRWPILEDRKLVMPHLATLVRSQRVATAATIRVGDAELRVYSVHFDTPLSLARDERADQLRAVLADAAAYPRVVIGGDFNSGSLPEIATRHGYAWPTRDGPSTVSFFRWDHILHRGLETARDGSGTVLDNRDASDHRPVWTKIVIPPP